MKKLISILMAGAAAITVLSGCQGTGTKAAAEDGKKVESESGKDVQTKNAPEIVFKYGEPNPEEHPMSQGALKFKELLEERSGGRIRVDLYFNGTLGDEKTSMQALQIGTMDFFRATTNAMPDYGVDTMNAMALPYVFRDLDHLSKALRSDLGEELLDDIQEAGTQMVGISYMEEGPRNLFFTGKAVSKLADLKGLKIRVPENQVMLDTIKALGANPTPISYSELYTSLQTGVVDGAENGITGYISNSFFEVAPYYVKDAHTFGAGILLMSEKSWNELSEEDQKLVKEAGAESMDAVLEYTKEIEVQYYSELESKGVTCIEVEDLDKWQEAVQPLYASYSQEVQNVIARVQAIN